MTHPVVVAARTARVLASLDVERAHGWRRRRERPDPAPAFVVTWEGLAAEYDEPEP